MKQELKACVVVGALALASGAASAGTVIDVVFGEAGAGTVQIENGWARANRIGKADYLLAALDTKDVYVVNQKGKEIVTLKAELNNESNLPEIPQPAGTTLSEIGAGPNIASFDTTQFDVRIGELECGSLFVAKTKSADYERYEAAMSEYSRRLSREMLARAPNNGMTADVCDLAMQAIEPRIRDRGSVLRFVRDGQTLQEVLGIHESAKVQNSESWLPKDFAHVNLLDRLPPSMAMKSQTPTAAR